MISSNSLHQSGPDPPGLDGFHCPVTAMAFKMALGRGKGKGRGGPSSLAAFADDVP